MIEKEEITSTEFPEGGNTIYTNKTPGIPTGGRLWYAKGIPIRRKKKKKKKKKEEKKNPNDQ